MELDIFILTNRIEASYKSRLELLQENRVIAQRTLLPTAFSVSFTLHVLQKTAKTEDMSTFRDSRTCEVFFQTNSTALFRRSLKDNLRWNKTYDLHIVPLNWRVLINQHLQHFLLLCDWSLQQELKLGLFEAIWRESVMASFLSLTYEEYLRFEEEWWNFFSSSSSCWMNPRN